MKKIEQAIQLDIEKKYIEAADAYEKLIEDDEATLDVYINLACLYWNAVDPGVSATNNHPNSFFRHSGQRMYKVLKEAEDKFGELPELDFWKRYFDFTIVFEPEFPQIALNLAEEGNILVPYFHVYSATKDAKYLPYVKQLIAICKQQKTAKNRYILSISDR